MFIDPPENSRVILSRLASPTGRGISGIADFHSRTVFSFNLIDKDPGCISWAIRRSGITPANIIPVTDAGGFSSLIMSQVLSQTAMAKVPFSVLTRITAV